VLECAVPHLVIENYQTEDNWKTLEGVPDQDECYMASIQRVADLLSMHHSDFKTNYQSECARNSKNNAGAEEIRNKGNALFNNQKKYELALQHYKNAARLRTSDNRIYFNQCMALMKLERYKEAVTKAVFALLLNPFYKKVYRNLCKALLEYDNKFVTVNIYKNTLKFLFNDLNELKAIDANIASKEVLLSKNKALYEKKVNDSASDMREVKSSSNGKEIKTKADSKEVKNKSLGKENKSKFDSKEEVKTKTDGKETKAKLGSSSDQKSAETVVVVQKKEPELKFSPAFIDLNATDVYRLLLENGRNCYLEGKFIQSKESYSTIIQSKLTRNENERLSVELMICFASLEMATHPGDVLTTNKLKQLLELTEQRIADPNSNATLLRSPLHYLLSRSYFLSWHLVLCESHVKNCISYLKKDKNKLPVKVVGFLDTIPCSQHANITEWCQNGAWKRQVMPVNIADCSYNECEVYFHTGLHKKITDEGYKGHYMFVCDQQLPHNVHYHPDCWKTFKDNLNVGKNSKSKMNDKDFLEYDCFIDDCQGRIVEVAVFNDKKEKKSYIAKAKKTNKVDQKHFISKKSQDKDSNEGSSSRDTSEGPSKKTQPRKPKAAPPPAPANDPSISSTPTIQDYNFKLSLLKIKEEEVFTDHHRLQQLVNPPEIDPRKPFYIPELLCKNPNLLEKFYMLRQDPLTDVKFWKPNYDVNDHMITDFLTSMLEYVEMHGPVHVEDEPMMVYAFNLCDENMKNYIDASGGVVTVCLRGVEFALLDDHLTTRSNILKDSETLLKDTSKIFYQEAANYPRYENYCKIFDVYISFII